MVSGADPASRDRLGRPRLRATEGDYIYPDIGLVVDWAESEVDRPCKHADVLDATGVGPMLSSRRRVRLPNALGGRCEDSTLQLSYGHQRRSGLIRAMRGLDRAGPIGMSRRKAPMLQGRTHGAQRDAEW